MCLKKSKKLKKTTPTLSRQKGPLTGFCGTQSTELCAFKAALEHYSHVLAFSRTQASDSPASTSSYFHIPFQLLKIPAPQFHSV